MLAGETQACAEAAAEHVRVLEDQAIAQRTEHEEALSSAHAALEAAKAEAAQTLAEARAEHQSRMDAFAAELTSTQARSRCF